MDKQERKKHMNLMILQMHTYKNMPKHKYLLNKKKLRVKWLFLVTAQAVFNILKTSTQNDEISDKQMQFGN